MTDGPTRASTRDDVARLAGVSGAVVSYVLNNGPRPVSDRARARVLAAIEQLGYRRDDRAAALSSRHSRTLGLLIPDLTNPFFADLARRIEDIAFRRGFTVLIGNSAEDRAREVLQLDAFAAQRVAAVIAVLADVDAPLPDTLEAFGDRVVLVDRVPTGWIGSSVAVDNVRGGSLAALHLRRRGCRHPAILAGPSRFAHVSDRVRGFVRAQHTAPSPAIEFVDRFDFSSGRAGAELLLARDPRIDGLFCCTDVLAIGALAALRAAGRNVPGEVRVIGFDDVAQAAATEPALSTVAQPLDRIAAEACAIVFGAPERRVRKLVPRIIVRRST
jgi:LacI family transcriptional regulator